MENNNVIYGEYHDATRCCVEGFSCWVASICDVRGHLLPYRGGSIYDAVQECSTEEEARAWVFEEARQRRATLMLGPPRGHAGQYRIAWEPKRKDMP